LVKPSLSAAEAVHPVAPAAPALGSGLPKWRARYRAVHKAPSGFLVAQGQGANLAVYETKDGGVSWKSVAVRRQTGDFAERCPIDADGRSFTIKLSDDARSTLVNSLGPDGMPYTTVLAPADREIVAAACDADGMVVLLSSAKDSPKKLALCPFRRKCYTMKLPNFVPNLSQLSDVARINGTTVVAVSDGSIVRVYSSRDAGRSWTPASVAYDAGEQQQEAMGLPAPDRLLTLGDRLLLYGGAERSQAAYLALFSDDHGASWKTP
jgi:hypothetical protein